jgi:hypothetical protein
VLKLPQEWVVGQQGKKVLSQKLKQLGGSGERYTMQRPPIDKAKKEGGDQR